VQHLSREQQPLAEDRRQHIRVLAGPNGAEQYHIRIVAETLQYLEGGCLQRLSSRRRTGRGMRVTLEILGGNWSVRRYEAVGESNDVNAPTLLAWGAREYSSVLELSPEIETAQEAEDLPQRDPLLAETASERGGGAGPPQRERTRSMGSRRRDQKDARSVRPGRHVTSLRNFGARDTFRAVRAFLHPALVAALIVSACVQPPPFDTPVVRVSTPAVDADVAPDSVARRHLVDIRLIEPTIMVETRYATPDNFTGAPLPGYEAHRALLRRETAAALARVQTRARREGVALKIFDAYRPVRATLAMVEWAERTGQQRLLKDGYIASRSRHNLGLAVDLTLIGGDGRELDMGTPFDTFGSAAHTANATGEVATNRMLLVRLMEAEGFANYEKEWWHFSYEVPNPLRFDLIIR
jgi:D-alanyl-D-alanine dipeptidase